ncbi:hypothetical protein [Asticcacaulis taihuensis]|uniref:Uncharacterized protein n=1 Tax=Asticcacaulis taihuensis TaxID=260084 RepID=A0A1G4RDH7_9CAUL|nr:hypothetical protein [Asticcacaulis taihuensis]SCW54962.1 hypothetical protein SAMN02927928_1814 [Asticcacaulis taihuensis]
MDSKTLIAGGSVFAVIFAGVLFLPFDQLLKPAPPTYEIGPLTGRVESTFHKVPTDDRPQAVKDAEQIDSEVKNTEVYAKIEGRPVRPEAEVRAAVDDAPKLQTYVGYATLSKMSGPMAGLNDIDTTDMKIACFSIRQPAFGTAADSDTSLSSIHQMFLYDAARFIPLEAPALYTWVYSGCAEAVRSSPTISMTQYKITLRDLLPATPQYDTQRQQIIQSLNSKPKKAGA